MWGYKDNVYETERANVSKSQKFDLEYDIKCSCCTHRPQKSLNAWIPRQCPSDSNYKHGKFSAAAICHKSWGGVQA